MTRRSYRSQIRQSLHYFARPHVRIPRSPLGGPAAWRARDFASEGAWREVLDEDDVDELRRGLAHLRGRPMRGLSRGDLPLPRLARRIASWRHELTFGRGFVVVSGIPVDAAKPEDVERLYWALGQHLGIPGAQNPAGDLLGHVRDTGAPPDGTVRQYRTREEIDFHCDLTDVVGLLCLAPAKRGGQSRLASSVFAYDELLRRRPELADRLFEPFLLDTKGEGGAPFVPIVPCAFDGRHLRTFWHIGYFRAVERWGPDAALDDRAREVLDLYDEIMNEEGTALSMDLHPGDLQLVSNHTVTHGRGGYDDYDEPAKKRHLLRLWLSLPAAERPGLRIRRELSRAQVVWRLAKARQRPARIEKSA